MWLGMTEVGLAIREYDEEWGMTEMWFSHV